jgi:glycosyltransferase involved in cell wall biosynthesis
MRLIRKLRPDVVQTVLAPMDLLGGAATRFTGTPWILRESSSAGLYGNNLRFWVRSLFGGMSDAIVSNSAGGYEYWSEACIGRSLQVIPNAVPFDEIVNSSCSSTLPELGIDANDNVVLCAGRIDSGKNVENVITALARIADEVPFKAVICGDGKRRRYAEQLASELGVDHRIVFSGYIDNLWAVMNRADVLVSLSMFEGCPNVLLEAMACLCPLVVSDIPAHREILDDTCASLVNPYQPAQAAKAIKAALMDRANARERALIAQTRVASFTIQRTAHLYERVYLEVSNGSSLLRDLVAPADNRKWNLSAN